MELTFLIGKDGRNVKRAQSQRACTTCRQKKKRCVHRISESIEQSDRRESPNQQSSYDHNELSTRPLSEPATAPEIEPLCEHGGRSASPSRVSDPALSFNAREPTSHYWVGDSNPIVTLLDERVARLHRGPPQRGDIGAWLDNRLTPLPHREELRPPVLTDRGMHRSINSLGTLPPRPDLEALVNIYFHRIHPLLPLLDESEIRSELALGTLPTPLLQALCLVASKDRSALPHLRLGSDTAVLQRESFNEHIYNDIMRNMPKREEKKRVLVIQILTLLSLHEWGPDGAEESSLNLIQAVHHAQTIALHHLSSPEKHTCNSLKALFWCLWSLDIWNAAMNGRPIIFHDCDMSLKVTDVISLFKPPFRVWLRLAEYLGEVIRFYRPSMDGRDDNDINIPSFEDIIDSSGAWDTPPQLLDSLEFFYHALIMLFTHSQGLQGRSHSQASKIRRSHSILTIAALCRTKNMADLAPIPMSAYTLSLGFSVTYKAYKEAKLRSAQTLAEETLSVFHRCLESFTTTWWLAATMVRLGRHALDNIKRPDQADPGFTTNDAAQRIRNARSHLSLDQETPPFDAPKTRSTVPDEGAHGGPISTNNPVNGFPSPDRHSPDFSSHSDWVNASSDDIDAFFNNFLDLNFPASSTEQFLCDSGI
ncbi:hypothetical protein BDV26DRAFT_287367 [Aspergillus bertholletiae]|uniref:Xylanolytic transcriptional activator regulatory domain-containing protein n=1 Tax=Aspergillus bertholletiae TaxID=1226010 RepID=A0A5N7BNX1_9EURO|nr:hypothetical protein BDV26DRAFT_287367 [Aspergillus bertholletiae]